MRTTVLAHWSTTKPVHRVGLADGTEILASGEHRFLTAHGWRHVGPGWCRSGRRRRLRPGDLLHGPGPLPVPRAHSESYRQGYLHGLVRADGVGPVVRDGRIDRIDAAFPSERLELEALGRAHHFLAAARGAVAARLVGTGAGPAPEPAPCRRSTRPRSAPAIRTTTGAPDSWAASPTRRASTPARARAGRDDRGPDGAAGVVRLAVPDDELTGSAAGALHRLGFRFVVEPGTPSDSATCGGAAGRGVRHVRLTGGSREFLRFLAVADPAVSRVRGLAGAPVGADPGLEVVDVRALGEPVPMFDVTTGTGDFVAAGAVSHNCFARNTHTYLDLDAGADFDRQIVVKVNVGRVLDRELAPRAGGGSPSRWAPTPIRTSGPRDATGSCPGSSGRWRGRGRRSRS